ncbi:hypothetical protein B0H14DRAFT_3861686 [Mycena olivaceomarginata]|nr:hypothetical protein B0H14DRAFT_3861686 [Mycena olivaceomarginata]
MPQAISLGESCLQGGHREFAYTLLDPGRFAGKELDLVNELLTFEEIAAHLGKVLEAEVKVKYRTAEETAESRSAAIGRQLWRPTTAPGDASKLAEYEFRLTTLKEFLEREKSDRGLGLCRHDFKLR